MVPMETMTGRGGVGKCDNGDCWDGFVFPSNVPCIGAFSVFGGIEEDVVGFECSGTFVCAGMANASSANAAVTRCEISFGCDLLSGDLPSKSILLPESCSRENWSKVGKRLDSSSPGALNDREPLSESSAANGSLAEPRRGEGLGLVATCSDDGLVGLPRLIGTISGTGCCTCIAGALKAPTTGGEVVLLSGDDSCWLLPASDLDRPV